MVKILSNNFWFLVCFCLVFIYHKMKQNSNLGWNHFDQKFILAHNIILVNSSSNILYVLNWVPWTSNEVVVFSFNIARHAFWHSHFQKVVIVKHVIVVFLLYLSKPYGISVKDISVNWDPTLHMALHERLQEAAQDMNDLRGKCKLLLLVFLDLLTRRGCCGKLQMELKSLSKVWPTDV